jgi:hypothetical protein
VEKAAFERRQDSRRQAWHDQESVVPLVPAPRAAPAGLPGGTAVEPAARAGEVAVLLEQLAADIAGQARSGQVPGYLVSHLHERFVLLKDRAAAESGRMTGDLEDITSALQLVQLQISALLAAADDRP